MVECISLTSCDSGCQPESICFLEGKLHIREYKHLKKIIDATGF